MGNRNKNIHSKSICRPIGKIVAIFNAVVSMEFRVLDSIICFQISLHEIQFLMKYMFVELYKCMIRPHLDYTY